MSTQRKWAIALMALGGLSILTGLYLDYIVLDYLLNPLTWAGAVGVILWLSSKPEPQLPPQPPTEMRTPDGIAEYATSGNWEDRRKLAAHPHVPEEIWRRLATDKTVAVRLALASNKNIPTDLLDEIAAKDRNAVVSNAADKTLGGRPVGWEPSQPEERIATEESNGPIEDGLRGDLIERIERLAKLYQDGLITEEEYSALKARLIVD